MMDHIGSHLEMLGSDNRKDPNGITHSEWKVLTTDLNFMKGSTKTIKGWQNV